MVRCELCGRVMEEDEFNRFHCSNCGISVKMPVWKAKDLHKVKSPSPLERLLEAFVYKLPWFLVMVLVCYIIYLYYFGQVLVVHV